MDDLLLYQTLLSGIIGGVAVYYVPRLIRYARWRNEPLLIYYFFDCRKSTEDWRRRISHSYGKMIQDLSTPKGKAWEHTSTQIEPGGLATCYGPYTKELSDPGKYIAKFWIKASGIKRRDETVLTLDIAYAEISGGQPVVLGLPLMEMDLKGSDFLEGEYKDFNLGFSYNGQNLLEFRCLVKNPQNYQEKVERLVFDRVVLYRAYDVY